MDSVELPQVTTVDYGDPVEDITEMDATVALMHKVEDMMLVLRNTSAMDHSIIATLESHMPGCIVDNSDYMDVSTFSPEAVTITMEKLNLTYVKTALKYVGILGSGIFKASKIMYSGLTKASAFALEHYPRGTYQSTKSLINDVTVKVPSSFAKISAESDNNTVNKLIKQTAKFTGLNIKNLKDVEQVLDAVSHSKNACDLMEKMYLPRFKDIALEMSAVDNKSQKELLKFTSSLKSKVAPSIATNFEGCYGELLSITGSRDWERLSAFDYSIYSDDLKSDIRKFAIQIDIPRRQALTNLPSSITKSVKVLAKPANLKDGDKIKNPISDTLNDLNLMCSNLNAATTLLTKASTKSSSQAEEVVKGLRGMRGSKTLKETLANVGTVNSGSNKNYSRILHEIHEVNKLIAMTTGMQKTLIGAHNRTTKALTKLDNELDSFINSVNKIKGT